MAKKMSEKSKGMRMPSMGSECCEYMGHFAKAKYLAKGHNDMAGTGTTGGTGDSDEVRRKTAELRKKNDAEYDAFYAKNPIKSTVAAEPDQRSFQNFHKDLSESGLKRKTK